MVIPANKVHLTNKLEPMCIGVAATCKINANIGNSAVTSESTVSSKSCTRPSISAPTP